jgi:hypothetical protein
MQAAGHVFSKFAGFPAPVSWPSRDGKCRICRSDVQVLRVSARGKDPG